MSAAAAIPKPKDALVRCLSWIGLALLFAAGIFLWQGWPAALDFATAYVIEFSLSLDNLAAIALIFAGFGVAANLQHRVLAWGIIGAVMMRGLLIVAGAVLIQKFRRTLYLMGGFLVFTGARWAMAGADAAPAQENFVLRLARKIFPVADDAGDGNFFVWKDGRRVLTPLALVLLLVETTDLIFAFDSIPAVFAVTQKPFLVFTSNIFAILGLRSLYFLVEGALRKFRYLKAGLAVVLILVGAKILVSPWYAATTVLSLALVAVVVAFSIWLSVLDLRRKEGR